MKTLKFENLPRVKILLAKMRFLKICREVKSYWENVDFLKFAERTKFSECFLWVRFQPRGVLDFDRIEKIFAFPQLIHDLRG